MRAHDRDHSASRSAFTATVVATAVDAAGLLPVYLIGAMGVQLERAIGLDTQSLGLVFAAYFGPAASLSLPMGRLTEIVDPGVLLRTGIALYVAAFLGMAVVPNVGGLVVLAAAAGVATSLTRTTSTLLVARHVPTGRQGLALGIRNCAIPTATLLAGLAVPTVALTVGWRWVFVIAAGLSVMLFVASPRSVPRRESPSQSTNKTSMPMSLLVCMAVAAALASAAAVSLGAFTAVAAVDAGMSGGSAGLLIASASVIGVASRIGAGWWTDRRSGSQLEVVTFKLTVASIAYWLISLGNAPLLWVGVPLAYATGWAFYGSYYLSVIRLNNASEGAAVGVAQSGAFTGSIVGPPILGAIANQSSFSAAWVTAAGAVLVAASLILVVESRLRLGGLDDPKTA